MHLVIHYLNLQNQMDRQKKMFQYQIDCWNWQVLLQSLEDFLLRRHQNELDYYLMVVKKIFLYRPAQYDFPKPLREAVRIHIYRKHVSMLHVITLRGNNRDNSFSSGLLLLP